MSAPEYTLRVVCDHGRQPAADESPARVIAALGYFPRPEGSTGWLEWRELDLGDPEQPPALQTYFGEARRLGWSAAERSAHDLVPGMAHGQRWRFYCRDCADTEPMRHDRLVTRLDELRHAAAPFVLLRQLAPTSG